MTGQVSDTRRKQRNAVFDGDAQQCTATNKIQSDRVRATTSSASKSTSADGPRGETGEPRRSADSRETWSRSSLFEFEGGWREKWRRRFLELRDLAGSLLPYYIHPQTPLGLGHQLFRRDLSAGDQATNVNQFEW